MSSKILKSFSRSALAGRSFQRRGQGNHIQAHLRRIGAEFKSTVIVPSFSRANASTAAPGQASNVSNPQASSAQSQDINKSASVGQTDKNDADHASIQNPVSHPEQDRAGASEETTESQDHMKHDPKESDAKKKEKTLSYGQNKPLDAADK